MSSTNLRLQYLHRNQFHNDDVNAQARFWCEAVSDSLQGGGVCRARSDQQITGLVPAAAMGLRQAFGGYLLDARFCISNRFPR
jgi:hypothetical protein